MQILCQYGINRHIVESYYYTFATDLIKFKEDAPDAPDVTGLGPAELEDHLRRPVVPGADHRAVVLPVEGRWPEVDQLDPGVAHAPDVPLVGRAVVADPVRAHKQDILGLQVRVGQVVVMKKLKINYKFDLS